LLFRDAADLASKIELIENDPALAEQYRRNAPERVRNVYNWERITAQYEELFYLLANGEDATQKHSSVREADREPVVATL
ncbi:MAG: glycosyltransferase, partial [Actinomycetota bacterium]